MKEKTTEVFHQMDMSRVFRRLLISWLLAALVQFAALPASYQVLEGLDGLRMMSLVQLFGTMAVCFALLTLAGDRIPPKAERWLIPLAFGLLWFMAWKANPEKGFLRGGAVILAVLAVYASRGWDASPGIFPQSRRRDWKSLAAAAVFAWLFFRFVADWGVYRYKTFSNTTYDFGIFAQMFHSMATNLTPVTTLERDGLLSHFAVHVSPIFYLMLPVYWLAPEPETIQILQGAMMAAAAIPVWRLAKHHGFQGPERVMLILVLFLYPAYAGGASYDIHENACLTTLILWLFYGIDRKSLWRTGLFALLVLMVKEDAAVYVAVIGLWLLIRALLGQDAGWNGKVGGALLMVSLAWFFATTSYLASSGDGVMTGRYDNLIYDGSGSLLAVVKAVLLSPMKALYECMNEEKYDYLKYSFLALGAIPLLTRRYERLVLLIPYILLNLLSDYPYQHDIFFQYSFGSVAFLMYLVIVNLKDLRVRKNGETAKLLMIAAMVLGAMLLGKDVLPKATYCPEVYEDFRDRFEERAEMLEVIPDDAVVAATGFITPHLAQREIVYDVKYCSREHLLSAEYIAIDPGSAGCVSNFKTETQSGYEVLTQLLQQEGYVRIAKLDTVLEIYQRTA